ncbi:phospho-sugar mutase [Pseudoclavibacter chungangensis]|uniref:Phospho-sugar mutase n=1 Tax=Pseudoclavibacter chungangensis TaxID=587635 RepID=A0A7J5BYK4_9MICO|nr:phospho-sugar mutase [Pseudoclavibacter chungangensis]KAB1659446.1 phospho-sugar mutase [Pseudoclavibacter chungangensis]NYJ67701.1 phosphomannomutase [Pseudoclavibacter chungangensis]
MSGEERITRPLQIALRYGAESWMDQDPDAATRAEMGDLLRRAGELCEASEWIGTEDTSDRADAWRALEDRFRARLAFGTAGLRGELGAGPNRMNRVLVAQAARGFADYLLAREAEPTIVVGYDARINSDVFARDTAEIMQAAGVRATLLPRRLPTPVLAFAVRHLGASAGVMVTASHNPKRDNGYKVYLGGEDGGSQIVAPADAEIAQAILDVANGRKLHDIPRAQDYEIGDESIVDAYVDATAAAFRGRPGPLNWVYTPMHGVGLETFERVLDRIGVPKPAVVRAQADPDGAFPTLDFPNPEEPGALDLAFAAADTASAELIIAHDPDADRLAVAIPTAGGWRAFGGNDIGKLLGWRAAQHVQEAGTTGTLATSLVSSPALEAVATAYGLDYAETPTGFKWISRAPGIVFGYEEALGYLVDPDKVHDKDGLSAAVAILELAIGLAAENRTLADLDADFADRFGTFASRQVSNRFAEVSEIPRIMAALRAALPTEIGGVRVAGVDDFADGFGDIPPSDILRLRLEDGTRIMVRPSGTEPKIKVYIDAQAGGDDAAARERTANRAADGAADAMRELLAGI